MKMYAEILVECGYAMAYKDKGKLLFWERGAHTSYNSWTHKCDPFADTLEGRRQADAIEDWLTIEQINLWEESKLYNKLYSDRKDATLITNHQWRLDRINWCVEQLEKE